MSPRAFISVPTASAVRWLSPCRRAAAQHATPFAETGGHEDGGGDGKQRGVVDEVEAGVQS